MKKISLTRGSICQWLSGIRKTYLTFPAPLQKHIIMHGLFSMAGILLSVILYCLNPDLYILLPPFGISLFALCRGILLFRRITYGDYSVVEGTCIEIESTTLRKRTKALVFLADGRKVKVQLKQRRKKIMVGALIQLYVANSTVGYDRDGYYMLYDYLALEFPSAFEAAKE